MRHEHRQELETGDELIVALRDARQPGPNDRGGLIDFTDLDAVGLEWHRPDHAGRKENKGGEDKLGKRGRWRVMGHSVVGGVPQCCSLPRFAFLRPLQFLLGRRKGLEIRRAPIGRIVVFNHAKRNRILCRWRPQ